jgi:hypothetical protein
MQEILALKGGRNPIRGVTYNALEMMRNPLYVKMAQEMKDESMDHSKKVQAEITNLHEIRNLAGRTGLPADVVHQMVQTLPQGADQTTQTEDPDEDMDEQDDSMGKGGGNDDDDSGDSFPPRDDSSTMGEPRHRGPEGHFLPGHGLGNRGPGPGGGGAGSSQSNSTQLRSQLQMQAEVEELQKRMRKQESQKLVMRDYAMDAARPTDPISELVQEVHNHYHVSQNAPAPPIVIREQQDLSAFYQAIQEGRRTRADLVAMGQQLGMAHAQILHLLAQKKKDEDEAAPMQSSSSSGGPPPPPAPKAKMKAKKREDPSPADEKPPKSKPKAAPKTPPTTVVLPTTPASEASTAFYPPSAFRAQSAEPRSRPSRGKATEEFSIATPRASSEKPASTPHTKSKQEKIVQQLVEAQNDQLVKSSVKRNLLGKFQQSVQRAVKNRKNPMLAPKRAQTYEEVAEAAIVGEQLPFGSAIAKQRIDTPGKTVRRFQGQRIRPT